MSFVCTRAAHDLTSAYWMMAHSVLKRVDCWVVKVKIPFRGEVSRSRPPQVSTTLKDALEKLN